MPIKKTIPQQGQALTYHEVNTVIISFTRGGTLVCANLMGYPDEAARLENVGGLPWTVQTVADCADHYSLDAVEAALVASGELEGGQIITEPVPLSPLEYAKARKWTAIKAARQAEIYGPLVTPYGVFDADRESQKRITDAIMLLQTLEGLGQPTTVDFVLFDNSTIELTTSEMVNVGLILGQKTQAAINKASGLRATIEAAATVEEVEAVTWGE